MDAKPVANSDDSNSNQSNQAGNELTNNTDVSKNDVTSESIISLSRVSSTPVTPTPIIPIARSAVSNSFAGSTSHGTAASSGNKIISRNVNGTMTVTTSPTNEAELQLYRVLQRASLLSYYDTLLEMGGDDLQQLCDAGEEEFLEIMALIGMASKPLHVRRLQKALQEWMTNPSMFHLPLISISYHEFGATVATPAAIASNTRLLSQAALVPPTTFGKSKSTSPKSTCSSSPIHASSPIFGHIAPGIGPVDTTRRTSSPIVSVTRVLSPNFNQTPTKRNTSSPSHNDRVSTPSTDETNGHSDSIARAGKSQSPKMMPPQTRMNISPCSSQNPLFPLPEAASSGCTNGTIATMIATSTVSGSGAVLVTEGQVLQITESAKKLSRMLPLVEPKPSNMKKKLRKQIELVMLMPEDEPARMHEIRKYSAIYGRFDCKRKAEKPLTLHELLVNEAAAQLCRFVPTLLFRRDELFPLARQIVRNCDYRCGKLAMMSPTRTRSLSTNSSDSEINAHDESSEAKSKNGGCRGKSPKAIGS